MLFSRFARRALPPPLAPLALVLTHRAQENVISNSMKGKNILNLSGMGEIGTVNGVCIHRPLIEFVKEDIFDFAHVYGVPYFKDTTPSWSTRGLMRNKLMPLLTEMFGEGFSNNLTSLAKSSDDAQKLVREAIIEPFRRGLVVTNVGCYFDTKPFADRGIFFWRTVLQVRDLVLGLNGAMRAAGKLLRVRQFVRRVRRVLAALSEQRVSSSARIPSSAHVPSSAARTARPSPYTLPLRPLIPPQDVLHSMNMGMISGKAVNMLVELVREREEARMRGGKIDRWLQCR